MTPVQAEAFVAEFAAARSKGRGEHLWHPQGKLHYPFASRVIRGEEIGPLCDLTAKRSPHLTWNLIGWTHRDDVIVVEWRCTNRHGDHTVAFEGVDKLTVRDGRIVEEVVYTDTAPLIALREGKAFPPLIPLPEDLLEPA